MKKIEGPSHSYFLFFHWRGAISRVLVKKKKRYKTSFKEDKKKSCSLTSGSHSILNLV